MRIIPFITDAGTARKILDHLGESAQPPRIAPARGPPLWELEQAHRHQAGSDLQWESTPNPNRCLSLISVSPGNEQFFYALTLGRLVLRV